MELFGSNANANGSVVADSGGVLKFSVGWVILAVSEWIVRL